MKRLLAVLLSVALAAGFAPAALAAAEDVPQREKAAVLRELEIMVGDETGDLRLDARITRAEFTKMLICASPYKDSVAQAAGTDPYPDVSHRDWFAPHVRAAVDAGLVKGDLAGWFHPLREITLAEGVTMAVRLLGYQDGDFTAPWPGGQLALYRAKDLDAGVAAQGQEDLLTRRDCLHLFYNLLCAATKTGASYVNQLGHTLNPDGEVDVAALFQVEQEGPIPLTGDWKALLPFDPADALVYRDSDRATLDDLREWDVLYWAKDQAILFALSGSDSSMGALAAAVEGPVVAEGGWEAKLPFSPDEALSVTRNGVSAAAGDIAPMDVVYWSKYGKNLYVYGRTVSGAVEAVSPSLAAPAAVTVAGVPYPLETFQAQYAFSDLGTFRKGDGVTLLLGRTGGVAAVRALEPDQVSRRVGVVSALGSRTYTDWNDKPYAAKVVTLTAADGQDYTYPYPWEEDELEPGDLVEVSVANGATTLSKTPSKSLSGTVNSSGTRLGRTPIAPDADILDTYGGTGRASVSPGRLAGVTLSGDMVRYYTTDAAGTITSLILKDVTGDIHTYGVMTDVQRQNIPQMLVLQGVYTFDVAGQSQTLPVSDKQFSVKEGPFCLKQDGQEPKVMENLKRISGVTLSGQTAFDGTRRYTLSDRLLCYLYDKGEDAYTFVTREQLESGGYTLSAWYDAPDAQGGRVRVLLGEKR